MPVPQDYVDVVLEHLLPHIEAHLERQAQKHPPFVLGLTGLQGSGKSTWATALNTTLRTVHGFNTINVSLDDFYRDHEGLTLVRAFDPGNRLLQTRGQPGTHDEELAQHFFRSLVQGSEDLRIPSFDKSRYDGEGDRVPAEEWQRLDRRTPVDVVIFEGWCLGFQPLSAEIVKEKWQAARQARANVSFNETKEGFSVTTLADHELQHLTTINENLQRYCCTFTGTRNFDCLIHLDTNDLVNVYRWRLQQEHVLHQAKGTGMSDEAVVAFVKGYMPAYELYLDQLRDGFFKRPIQKGVIDNGGYRKVQLHVLLDKERKVTEVREVGRSR